MRRNRLIILMLALVLLTGCLAPKISISIKPQEIKLTKEDMEVEKITVQFVLSGFSLDYKLNDILIQIVNPDDDEDILYSERQDPPVKSIPVAPGLTKDVEIKNIDFAQKVKDKIAEEIKKEYDEDFGGDIEDIPPEAYEEAYGKAYDRVLKGKSYDLVIVVEGTKTSTAKAKIIFE